MSMTLEDELEQLFQEAQDNMKRGAIRVAKMLLRDHEKMMKLELDQLEVDQRWREMIRKWEEECPDLEEE